MSKQARKRKRIQPLEFNERARVLAEVMNHESDHGCAVIGAEIVSNRLESLLRAFLRDETENKRFALDSLFVGYGPLTSFAAKIHISYSIQLIPQIIRDRLDMIRKIRNHFAHSQVRTSFSDAACADTLLLLANGKTDPPVAKEGLNYMRFAYTCAVAQTATVLESLESIVRNGGDIRASVLRYEKEEAFEYDWKKSSSKRSR
jgi:DNA-binding MltR family transcriptional regulator